LTATRLTRARRLFRRSLRPTTGSQNQYKRKRTRAQRHAASYRERPCNFKSVLRIQNPKRNLTGRWEVRERRGSRNPILNSPHSSLTSHLPVKFLFERPSPEHPSVSPLKRWRRLRRA